MRLELPKVRDLHDFTLPVRVSILQDILTIGNKHGVNIMTTMSMMRNNNKQEKQE